MVYGGSTKVVGAVLATTVAVAVLSAAALWRRKRSKTAVLRGQIAKIIIYPIKSCHGISVQTAKCTPMGLEHGILRDRSFMITDSETNKFISFVDNPTVVLIKPELCDDGKTICVNAPGMETLRLDVEELASHKGNRVVINHRSLKMNGYDCGDKYAQWFQTFLKKPNLRLVFLGLDLPPTRGDMKEGFGKLMKKTDVLSYSFTTAYSLNSESSHEDLARRLENPTPITNFRPNITVNGTVPYEEDKWDVVKLGEEAILQVRKLCQRCAIITVHAESGKKDNSVMKTLNRYRKCWDENLNKIKGYAVPLMGLNVGLEKEGTIIVGDPVKVTYK